MQTKTLYTTNINFLNNQNYILWKTEKKKLLSKFFVERILNKFLNKKISFLNSSIYIFFILLFIILLYIFFYSLLVSIMTFLFNFLLIGILLSWIIIIYLLLNVLLNFSENSTNFIYNIFTSVDNISYKNQNLLFICIICIISFIIYLLTYLFLWIFKQKYIIIKSNPDASLIEKLNFLQNNIAENKFYKIKKY